MIDANKETNVHFIGVGGVSMSKLAVMAKGICNVVTGSDGRDSGTLEYLRRAGVNAYAGSNVEYVKSADLVVYSSAITGSDPELTYARVNNIRTAERKDFLAYIAGRYDKSVAVAGSHGKSTTTDMIRHILSYGKTNFVAHVGDGSFNDVVREGAEIFLTEACEYSRSLVALKPYIGVLLNIDFDHPDTYSNVQEIEEVFTEFLSGASGYVILRQLDALRLPYFDNAVTFGESGADYNIEFLDKERGRYAFRLSYERTSYTINLKIAGKHNVYNAAAAFIAARLLGVDPSSIVNALECYYGLPGRFECLGKDGKGIRIIADYAHHPTEIKASIDMAREMTEGKLIVAFEPHTYSRTKALLEEFKECFYWANVLIILPTYAARELPEAGIDSLYLYNELVKSGYAPLYSADYDKLNYIIDKLGEEGDILLLIGAGNISSYAKNIYNSRV